MGEWAKVLLDRAPYYGVTRPLSGAALGAGAGGLYGALSGSLYGALHGTLALIGPWGLVAVAAGAIAGFLMGVCSALDRAANRRDFAGEPRLPETTGLSDDDSGRRRRGDLRSWRRADRIVLSVPFLPSGRRGWRRGTPGAG
jgi:hypothetical protein